MEGVSYLCDISKHLILFAFKFLQLFPEHGFYFMNEIHVILQQAILKLSKAKEKYYQAESPKVPD